MMLTLQNILFGTHGTTTYLFLLVVMLSLAVLTIWHLRKTDGNRAATSVIYALIGFFLSRLMIVDIGGTVLGPLHPRVILFSALNLTSFYFFIKAVFQQQSFGMDVDAEGDKTAVLNRTKIVKEMGLFAAVGCAVYMLRPGASSSSFSPAALANLAMIGATVRLYAFHLKQLRSLAKMHRCAFCISVALLAVSWILFEVSTLMAPGSGARLLQLAKFADVAALFLMLFKLFSNSIRFGLTNMKQATKSKEEIDAAKTEVEKLSRIATNIYEDSSNLMKKQKHQVMMHAKKVERLEKILEIGIRIQKRNKLENLLQMIVDLVKENLGFQRVILRLLNEKTQSFETKALVGVDDDARERVTNYRMPLVEFQKMIEPRFRISGSYFIRGSDAWYGEELEGEDTMRVENAWHESDMLIVPLLNDNKETVGYLSVQNPDNSGISIGDMIDSLEHIALLAIIAIRNASLFKSLEEKNKKLSVFADKLASLHKLKSNFVQTISHEFRTPLTSIRAYSDTLIKNVDDVDRRLLKEFLVVIDEESQRLMTLIDDILDFASMESGAIKFERSPCNLTKIVKSAVQELGNNFAKKSIDLQQTLPEHDVMIRADTGMVSQLITNLLHNASKFSREGSKVRTYLEDENVSVRFIVEDEGIGVPDDQLDKVFEQFHQVDNSSTRKYGGSGLGLAMCKNIVEWHDGKIWVENVNGGGARFIVVLPKKEVVVKSHVITVGSTVGRFEIDRFLELVVENVAEFMDVRKASVMLLDKERNELRIECAIGIDEEIVQNARVHLGEGISGKVAMEGRTMLVKNIEEDDRVGRANNAHHYGQKTFLCVPMTIDGEVVGVLNISNPIGRTTFTKADARLLETFAERLSQAVAKLRYFAEVSVSYEQLKSTLKALLDSQRYIDRQYTELITSLVSDAADLLGFDDEAKTTLHYIMNVYDLGLSRIGYHILQKPEALSPAERDEIEKHTLIGKDMLDAIENSPQVKNVVLYHHENYDGTGYPGKLRGEAIPIEARIIRVVDSLRALISRRSYQKQYTISEAKEVLESKSGSFFDPKVVDAFIEAIDASGFVEVAHVPESLETNTE